MVMRLFQLYTLLFSLGVYVQLYFFHYKKALQQINIQQGGNNLTITYTWEVVYALLIFGMQTLKMLWNLAIVFFSLRLKQNILKYNREYEKLK